MSLDYYFLFQEEDGISEKNGAFSVVLTDCTNDIGQTAAFEIVSEKAKSVFEATFRTVTKRVELDPAINYLFFMSHLPSMENGKRLIVCFMTCESKANELVIEDMRWFCDKVRASEPYDTSRLQNILPAWLSATTSFVSVVVKLLGSECSKLIFASLTDMKVTFSDQWVTSNDSNEVALRLCCERFLAACHLSEIAVRTQSEMGVERASAPSRLTCSLVDGKIIVSITDGEDKPLDLRETTAFCEEWSTSLVQQCQSSDTSGSSAELRKLLENYRLRVLQDLNFCNRLMKTAETDYYGFYRLYLFVSSHSNSAILLEHLSRSHLVRSTELSDVITSLSLSMGAKAV